MIILFNKLASDRHFGRLIIVSGNVGGSVAHIALCLLIAYGMAVNGYGKPIITVETPLPWLHLTSSTDPSFASTVTRVVGSNARLSIQDVLPYAVVITNSGVQPIAGLSIRFQLKIKGRIVKKDFFYHSFGQPQRPVLKAGESSIFTPSKAHNAFIAQVVTGHTAGGGGTGGLVRRVSPQGMSSLMEDLLSAEQLHISIDLAIASDGRSTGLNHMHSVDRMKEGMVAHDAMSSELLARLMRGESDKTIIAWLTPLSKQMVLRDRQTGLSNRFVATQVLLATSWLDALRAGRRSVLQADVSQLAPDVVSVFVKTVREGLK